MRMKVLDLFSGIGGFSLGLERAGFETVAFCEVEPFCQKVLKKHWPDVPIYKDIRKLSSERLQRDGITSIDVICGGYPCQPFSAAGKQRGEEDDRHLWPEMQRLIQEIRPNWVIAENVANHVRLGLDSVLSDLEALGYTWGAYTIPACAIDAPHKRERLWIVAHNSSDRGQGSMSRSLSRESEFSWFENVRGVEDFFSRPDIPKPLIGRDDDGFSNRVDRLRGLGNAVVPGIVEQIGRGITQQSHEIS